MALFTTEDIVLPKGDPNQLFASDDESDFVICKNPEKLQLLLDKIQDKKQVFFVSDGDWSMHDLVMQLLKQFCPAELFITTYAIRELAIRQMILAMERKEITAVNMLLDYRAQVRTPEVYQFAAMNLNKICLTGIHAKVTVMRTPTDCISIIGSANWTSNPRVEAGIVSMNKDLAAFNINWIQKLMDNAEIFE